MVYPLLFPRRSGKSCPSETARIAGYGCSQCVQVISLTNSGGIVLVLSNALAEKSVSWRKTWSEILPVEKNNPRASIGRQ